ncbi:ribosomal 40S subunit protein S1B [Mucor velutinosus]|uniref:Ribosomal 40S subunit protein S1B n=1 Tax=Mucor velutinosus TaxID=708070 RepID=A0AAN7D3D9_9FUNG|nr:ribosomal 40S subunit protein S1B [Mucor velutinosus]
MSNRRQQQQQANVLPHLSKGIAMPEIQVSNHNDLMMPGQKALPSADWKNSDEHGQNQQQLVPASDPGPNRRLSAARQGVPWTDRQSKLQIDSSNEPPPMFTAAPKKMSIRHPRESMSSKHIYRMDNGIDPVILLTSRLEAWRLAIKNLVALFKKVIAVELKTSKGLVLASRDIVVPFDKSNGQFLEIGMGGIQDVWASMRDYTMQHGMLHHESAGYLEKAVIPALRAIKNDIKTMIIAIQKDKALKSTDIFESRMQVDRLISRLDKIIQSCNRSPQTANDNTDPFLVNLGVIHAVRELCDHENRLHDNILNLQKETGIFEQKIIENTRYVIQKLEEFRLKNKMEHQDFIGKVVETFNGIKPTLEWNEFVRRNQYNLILENSAYKTENMVEYPNQDSKFVRALKIGPLQIKAGVMKGWTEGVYLLTPAGFLHGYKTPKHFQTNPLRPNYTVFVPDCAIERFDDGSFDLHGKDKRLSMGQGTRYTFRARNPRDSQGWFEALVRIADQFRIVPLFDTAQSGFSSTVPKNRDLPPLPASTLPLIQQPPSAPEKEPRPAGAIQSTYNTAGPSGTRQDDLDPVLEEEQDPVLGDHQPLMEEHHTDDDGSQTPVAGNSLHNEHLPHPAVAVATGAAAGAAAAGAVDVNQHLHSEKTLGQDQSRGLTEDPATPVTPTAASVGQSGQFVPQQQQNTQTIHPPQSQLADLSEQQDFDKRPLEEQRGLPTSDVPTTSNKTAAANEEFNDGSNVDNWQSVNGGASKAEGRFDTASHHSKIADHLNDEDEINLANQQLQASDAYTPIENYHLQQTQKQETAAL